MTEKRSKEARSKEVKRQEVLKCEIWAVLISEISGKKSSAESG